MEIKKAPPPTGFRTAYLKAVADVAEMNHQNAREKRRNAEEEALKKALREPAATAQNVPLETVSPLSDPTGSPPVELESGKLAPGQYGGIDQFKSECLSWGFDPKVEGPRCCDEQFDMTARMHQGIEMAMLACHSASYYAGWWHDKETGKLLDQAHQVPVKLMLIVSEVSEAMEGDRKGCMDDKLPHRPMFEVELADVFIRLMDLAGATGIDLASAVVEKMAFNRDRADHKQANRNAAGGKAY